MPALQAQPQRFQPRPYVGMFEQLTFELLALGEQRRVVLEPLCELRHAPVDRASHFVVRAGRDLVHEALTPA